MDIPVTNPARVYCDNQGTIVIAANNVIEQSILTFDTTLLMSKSTLTISK